MSNSDWQKIYSNYSPKLLGICRRYIQDIYTAEDIVHDSFITAIQKTHQLNDEKAMFAWLKKIVVNNALQHIRKYSKDTFVSTESSEIPDTNIEMDHPTWEEKNIFIYDFTREELLSCIDNLPPHHKSVFNLYFIENHSHAEISGLLGITVNTSKSHLLRAKKSVQNYLVNNFVNQNTPKNKIAQLLVLFGMGGLLWAQTFKGKFAEFKIQPSKKLEIPSNTKIVTSPVSFMGRSFTRKIIIGTTFLIIIITSLFLFNHQKKSSLKNFPDTSLLAKTNTEKTMDAESNSHNGKAVQKAGLQLNDEAIKTKTTLNKLKEKPSDKSETEEVKNIVSEKNSKKMLMKDSLHEMPQKVIVVKKIIKRDTIFIER